MWYNIKGHQQGLAILWKSCDLTELKKKECVVDFGNEQRYCSCTCSDFQNNRNICKCFFAVIERNHRKFSDISKLLRIVILFG